MNNETEQIFLLTPTETQSSTAAQKLEQASVPPQDVEDFSTVCRTCATVTEFVIPIFAGEGVQNNLADKIHKHLPIQVSETDVLPRVVCYQCANTLLAWHELVQCCVQADEALRTRLAVAAAKADSIRPVETITESKSSLKDIEESSEQEQNKWHSRIKVETGRNERDGFHDDPRSDSHGDGSDRSDNEDDEPLSSIASKKAADVYKNFYDALVDFRNHFVGVHSSHRTKHPELAASSDSEIASDDENKTDDRNIDNYDDLTDCNMRKDRMDEKTRLELSRVRTRIDGKAYYTCQLCGKNLSSSHTYVFHQRIHTGERPCVCHVCGKQFRAPGGLARHLTETHERARRLACALCRRSFANSQNLKQHLRVHTGERPYACAACGKRFAQSGSLHAHRKTHLPHFPHRCADCGAEFRLRAGLRRHALRHAGARPHACARCPRAFRERHELAAHTAAHAGARPHACPCGAAFRTRRALRLHARRLHPPAEPPRDLAPPPVYAHVANY